VCELAIRDLKAGAGLAHLPSGRFAANSAWLLAHPGPQPAALDRQARSGQPPRATGRQDAAPDTAHAARPAHPLRAAVDAAPTRRLAVGPLIHHGAGSAALHPLPDLTARPHHRLVRRPHVDRSGLPATAWHRPPSRSTTTSPHPQLPDPAASRHCLRASALRALTASGKQRPHSRIGGSRLNLRLLEHLTSAPTVECDLQEWPSAQRFPAFC
jgi:hypothetical protein